MARLTAREREVVELILDKGGDNDLIATAMDLRMDTVRHHITHIFDKLRFSSRTEMAVCLLHKKYEEARGA